MYGNCLTFAIYDFIKNGGEFCIEFWRKSKIPHFSVQRGGSVYDFEILWFIFNIIWYKGQRRITPANKLNDYDCKRYLVFNR